MKKMFLVILSIAIMSTLFGCSFKSGEEKIINKEGVYPYELSERESDLLGYLNLENDVILISFKAPQKAKSLEARSYVLNKNGNWDMVSNLHIFSGGDYDSQSELEGIFSMLLKDDYSIDMHITSKGKFSQKGIPLEMKVENLASSKSFLPEYKEIELNEEIPVAIMIYNNGMKPYTMNDFFLPSTFEGMELVQAVTLTFTDEEVD